MTDYRQASTSTSTIFTLTVYQIIVANGTNNPSTTFKDIFVFMIKINKNTKYSFISSFQTCTI